MSTYPNGADVVREADLSTDGMYRYCLRRIWWPADEPRLLRFIMLNPSTADATIDDPTIRRCVGFARREEYDGLEVYNLYAFRATKPGDMFAAADPVGPRNDEYLTAAFAMARDEDVPVIAAWGANAKPERVRRVMTLPSASRALHHLGLTKDRAPRHPLYLPSDAPLAPMVVAA